MMVKESVLRRIIKEEIEKKEEIENKEELITALKALLKYAQSQSPEFLKKQKDMMALKVQLDKSKKKIEGMLDGGKKG